MRGYTGARTPGNGYHRVLSDGWLLSGNNETQLHMLTAWFSVAPLGMVPPYFPLLFSIFRNPNGSPNRPLKAGVISAQNIYSFGFGKVRGCHQHPQFAGLTGEFPGFGSGLGPHDFIQHGLPRPPQSVLFFTAFAGQVPLSVSVLTEK